MGPSHGNMIFEVKSGSVHAEFGYRIEGSFSEPWGIPSHHRFGFVDQVRVVASVSCQCFTGGGYNSIVWPPRRFFEFV